MDTLRSYHTSLQIDGEPIISRPQVDGEVTVLPITFDTRLGEVFKELDINEPATLRHLRKEGFSEKEITTIPIHFSAKQTRNDDIYIRGHYTFSDGSVTLYPLTQLTQVHCTAHAEMLQQGLGDDCIVPLTGIDLFESMRLSETLWHEIRHAKQHRLGEYSEELNQQQYEPLRRRVKLGKIASIAAAVAAGIATHNLLPLDEPSASIMGLSAVGYTLLGSQLALRRYLKRGMAAVYSAIPAELDAFAAGKEAPARAVSMVPRDHYAVARLPEGTIPRRELINTAANLL